MNKTKTIFNQTMKRLIKIKLIEHKTFNMGSVGGIMRRKLILQEISAKWTVVVPKYRVYKERR